MVDNETKLENLIIEAVAHDLKGIIEKINCLNEMLHDKLKNNDDAEIRQIILYIDSLCEQGNQITNDLTETCELESYEEIHIEKCSLNQLIIQQAKIYKLQADKKQITFKTVISDKQFFCELNRSKFIRALDNLFSNALKFTGKGGQIKIILSNKERKAKIAVCDSGIGIPDELKNEIFKKYSKARRYGTLNEKFTGLGLYIVKKIIDLHKGKVWFNSEKNMGTTFYIELDNRIVI
jgi:two-component system sensor histidine kinase VicK